MTNILRMINLFLSIDDVKVDYLLILGNPLNGGDIKKYGKVLID